MKKEGKSINAIFGWIGGKRKLREQIAEYIPEQNITLSNRSIKQYVEVFGGVAWLLLYKPRWFEEEVYNDYNDELVNLFNVIRFHPEEFKRHFDFLPDSQMMFKYFIKNEQLTDIQKAVATYCKYAYSFSSNGEDYNYRAKSRSLLKNKIDQLSCRFDRVSISCMSYEKLIKRFNRSNTFLYCDPPYFGKEDLYKMKFSKDDHYRLFECLKNHKGKFLLSYNNVEEIRSLYKDFNIKELSINYSAFNQGDQEKERRELIIMNY